MPTYTPVWPGPALLVPITLDALLVGTPNQSSGSLWAATGVNYANLGSLGAGVTPFAQKTPPPVGAHLLWTLPYSLRSGQQTTTGNGAVNFHGVPNRWVILRSFVPPVSSSSFTPSAVAPIMVAGVLRGDSLHELGNNDSPYPNNGQVDGIGDYTPIEMWDGSTPGAPFLQAVGPGDVSWSAAYDNIRNVFAFHDDLSKNVPGFYTYQVIGWYSEPGSDPLSDWATPDDWTALMNFLGWGVGQDQANSLPAGLVGAAQQAWTIWQGNHGLNGTTFTSANINMTAVPGQLATLMTKWGGYYSANGSADVPSAQLSLPAQTLCHGSVLGVQWQGPNFGYDSGAPSNGLSGPTVAVGNTPAEALAAWMANWIARTTGQTNIEQIEVALEAFQKGLIYNLGKEPVETEAALHAARFGGNDGGSQWVVTRPQQPASSSATVGGNGDATIPLNTAQIAALRSLNLAQDNADSASDQVDSITWELWSCYFKLWYIDVNFLSGAEDVDAAIVTLIGAAAANNGGAIGGLLGAAQAAMTAGQAAVTNALTALQNALAADKTTAGFVVKNVNNTTFSRPVDPVVLIAGSAADTKYSPPGTYGSDGFTFTRFTGQTLTAITISQTSGPANPVTLGVGDLQAALALPAAGSSPSTLGIPKEYPDLWLETLLADGSCSAWLASLYLAKYQSQYQTSSPLSQAAAAQLILSQQTALWNDASSLGISQSALAAAANFTGVPPVPIALEDGSSQPWSPLFIDWQVEWHPATDQNGYPVGWQLTGLDYEWTGTQIPASTLIFQGRTSIDPSASQTIAQQLESFVASDPDFDSLPDFIQQDLTQVKTYIQNFDFVTQSLSGLTNQLITHLSASSLPVPAQYFGANPGPDVQPTVQSAQGIQPVPQDASGNPPPFFPVRAGHFRFTNLWVVDAYGQVLATKRTGDTYVHLNTATTVQTPGAQNADFVQLPPRFSQGTRLNLTMIDANDDSLASTSADATSPICGWIMANHLDDSLMVFDALGNNLGSVIVIDKDLGQTGLRWDAAPGSSQPLGSAPDIQNTHLAGFVNALLLAGATGSEAMRELLDVIDAASWQPYQQGQAQSANDLSVLAGRPIALVRTRFNIDLFGDPMLSFDENLTATGQYYPPATPPAFTTTPLSVRVGDESFSTNGALGYCIGDDYSTFYSVSAAPDSTSALRRQLALGQSTTQALAQMAEETTTLSAAGSYVTPGQPIPLSPKVTSGNSIVDTSVYVTVFVDPAGSIPVVSGAFPVLYGNLPAGPVATALSNMQISFRVGPLLLEPSIIKMPLPSEINGNWAWMERQSVTLWAPAADPQSSDAVPNLANVPLRLREGWLVLSNSQQSPSQQSS